MSVKFEEEINLITNKHTTMGIEEFILQRVKDEALEKGMETMKTADDLRFVKSLLTQTDFSLQKIAQVAEVSIAFVKEVKSSLGQSSN